MVRRPLFNDGALARELGARPSTVASVRTRLEERGFLRRLFIPPPAALGAAVLSIGLGSLPAEGPAELSRALGRGLFQADECDSFWAVAGPFAWLEMGAFRSYSDARRRGDWLPRMLEGLPGVADGTSERSPLPVEHVRFHNLFDFAPLLSGHFRLRPPAAAAKPVPPAPARRLSPVEKLCLYGLVRRPGASDRETAGELGVSRQAVARARPLLVREGRLIPAVVPDLRRLGLGILAVHRFRLDGRAGPEAAEAQAAGILGALPHFFAVSAGTELVVVAAYRDIASFGREAPRTAPPAGTGAPSDTPDVRTIMLDDAIVVRDLDFVPFVKSALGLDIAD
jgi:DNA-binding MarR family transcriptional regulator